MSAYWTSAQTEEAISTATSGKADAANVSAVSSGYHIPIWNDEGVITGETGQLYSKWFSINGINRAGFMSNYNYDFGPIFAPVSAGTAGQILVSAGNGAPIWANDDKVSSTSISTIWKGTQSEYDAITEKDPSTFYIIVNN